MRIEVDGCKVFVGTGTGTHIAGANAIVMVHGAAMDHTVWTLIARYFARTGFNVAAVDLPGHGRSEGTPLNNIKAMSDWLTRTLEVLEFERIAVVGHSMGSLVAMQFASDNEEKTEAISLLGTSLPMSVTPPLLNSAKANSHNAYVMANTWSHSARGKLGSNDNPGVWMVGVGERLMSRCREDVFYADLEACNSFELDPASVNSRTLLILGDADQMTPSRFGTKVAESISNAQIVELNGCGHAMLSERPNEILDALKAHHLSSVPTSRNMHTTRTK